jgi:hypothetical protein
VQDVSKTDWDRKSKPQKRRLIPSRTGREEMSREWDDQTPYLWALAAARFSWIAAWAAARRATGTR